ncbi:L,D-transpeptidase [Stenomitos frigidus]|uniref:L,D-transpeptidase n=1 Tax=Stenomitos frigidus ULC18 TaxID=2107698 RepID=A0A2T1EI42_9CYAN|nr:L,D-transpeptidase [Stenomitos frigidus]PSB32430.1 L,D-transpeptidase [Stenomitos frigidus ULC18]
MLQPSVKQAFALSKTRTRALLTFRVRLLLVSFLALSLAILADQPSSASSSAQPAQTTENPAAPPQASPKPPEQENAKPPSHLRIPAALAPYLDPGFHPDLRFEPDLSPTDADTQALRLEIRLSRRQVTLYRGETPLKSYAIAVGRPGWETPVGTYEVKQMIKNPTWVHPLQKGVVIPGGDPENPLGRYWIGFWTDGKNWIGFHGTPTPRSVGRAASHGCVRMYNKDVEELFKQVTLGTVVKVVK